MRRACLVIAALAWACGSDTSSAIDGPPGGTIDAPSTVDAGAPDANPLAPIVTSVSWTHTSPGGACTGPQDVTVTITATDTDTPSGNLTYSGSVSGCIGSLTAAVSTISCPEASNYLGSATVTDPQSNMGTRSFTVTRCANGSSP